MSISIALLVKAQNSISDDGLDLQEAVELAEFEDWKNTRLYGSNQRLNASFIYREMELELF